MDAVAEANRRLRELGYDAEDASVEANGSPERLRIAGRLVEDARANYRDMLAVLRMMPPKAHLLAYRHVLRTAPSRPAPD